MIVWKIWAAEANVTTVSEPVIVTLAALYVPKTAVQVQEDTQ